MMKITYYALEYNEPVDGHGNKFPMDIPTKRKQIYKYLGI